MKNSGKFQNSMRAVTINSEFSLPGLIILQAVGLASLAPLLHLIGDEASYYLHIIIILCIHACLSNMTEGQTLHLI